MLAQRVFPEQTIDGLQIADSDPNGSVSQSVFKSHLRSYLPILQPVLHQNLEEAFNTEIPELKADNSKAFLPRDSLYSNNISSEQLGHAFLHSL